MAVTILKRRTNINGAFREVYLNLNIGVSGDTYDTKLKNIIDFNSNTTAISSMSSSAGVVTFTTTGAVNNAFVRLTGW